MTTQEFLKKAAETLQQAGVPSGRLDCLVLLEDALKLDRATILAHPESIINTRQLAKLNKNITQRARHVPLAYIRGKAPFYGREFAVNTHVLVPRPETETMIEMLKKLPLPAAPRLADIGTGSGCIGITAALELPGSQAELYDIDPAALGVAAKNSSVLKANARYRKGDLLEKQPAADVILANLPYVPERYAINQAAEQEPKHAIFGGKDGLNLYRKFWAQVPGLRQKPLFIIVEALPTQHNDMVDLAAEAGFALAESQDFIQVFKR
jgi:release factor glutamine methyltransferase